MIIRILLMLASFLVLVNLCIITISYIMGINLYQKYGKQILIAFGFFVLIVVAFYIAISLIGLN